MLPERLAFVDLETTGTNPLRDAITEIGVVMVDGERVETWHTLVNPERAIPPFIEQLTGISNAMVAHAPTFPEVACALAERLADRLFIAHNARFDYGFLRQAYRRLDRPFRPDVLCTVRLSRALFPDANRHNLDSLIARHALSPAERHRALADADLIWQFWRVARARAGDAAMLDAITHQLKRPSLPPHLDPKLLDELPDSPGVYLFYGEDDVLLYVGKSINLRQRVLSHFSADTRAHRAMRLTQQIRHVEWRETVGELGALLLESRLVKAHQPLHNRRLKRSAEWWAWRLVEHAPGDLRPQLLSGSEADVGGATPLYGLYATRRQATAALEHIVDDHALCRVVLGLEKAARPDRPCFAFQIRQCRGACAGQESLLSHGMRLQAALAPLKLPAWTYSGPIGIVERNDSLDTEEIHVVDRWRHVGTATTAAEVYELLAQAADVGFDRDTYRLLHAHLAKGRLAIRRF